MNSVINECVGGKSLQDWHTRASTYIQTVTHSEWGAPYLYTAFMVEVKIFRGSSKFFFPPQPPTFVSCMVKWNSWHIHSQIETDSMWKPELCVCVFTCRSEQESANKAGLGVRVFVCGGRSKIRPIWFVLQSQIKKKSGEGEDGRGGEIAGSAAERGMAPQWQHARLNHRQRGNRFRRDSPCVQKKKLELPMNPS